MPYTLKKCTSIIKKPKSKYWQRTHKFGIQIPKSVKESFAIDRENGNSYWHDATRQEMPKIIDSVEEYNSNTDKLIGYQEITGHMIFVIKFSENFRQKAWYVADGHKTKILPSITSSTVVSREYVKICLTIAALNDLEILSADIENTYLTAPCCEKVWIRAGTEFGDLQGKILGVKKALYGLKSSGASFRVFLAEHLDNIGFKSSVADPDVWMREATKPDSERYYEYILYYVNDILCMSHDSRHPMNEIGAHMKFKKNKVEPPA